MTNPSDDKVVVQGNVVTSQGPGTSLLFALSLGEQMVSSKFGFLIS
jgi:putative intracellular protease/amidase